MSSESSPVVIIDRDNPSGYYWDASDITTKVVYEYGRNRPFAYAEVSVKKAYFNSAELYWNDAPFCPKDSSNNAILPIIELGTTTIHVESYGQSYDMIIDDKEELEDFITFKCYNKAYKLRSAIYLSSLCSMTGIVSGSTIKCFFTVDLINSIGTATISNRRFTLTYSIDSDSSISFNCILDSSNDIIVDYIEGTGSAIFKFIATKAIGFTPENCVCDKGYSYDYEAYAPSIATSYSSSDMQLIKDSPKVAGEDVVKLRVGYLCWDIIKALGYLSNRWAFFYDKAYFVDYNESNYCNQIHAMRLDYGVDDDTGENLSYTQKEEDGATLGLDIYHIVDSLNQGTSYVQSSQTVNSENHSEKVCISDATKEINGTDIVFPYPETYDSSKFDNSTRDTLTRKLAFERLATFFKPLDCVQFTISEMSGNSSDIIADYIVSDESELPESASNGEIGLITDGLMKTYYQYDASATGDKWKLYIYATYSNTRDSRFSVYTCISNLTDVQNNISMKDAPLSYVQLSWPECMTTFTFGNPEFIDSAYQTGQLEQNATVSVIDGTADLSISDKMSAKIVVGNQTLSDLDDERGGFTGLIMEKNRNSELYRLAGYNEGVLEAYFDSQGRILSGNAEFGSGNLISGVMIDHNGITIANQSEDKYVPYTIDSSGNAIINGNIYQTEIKNVNGGNTVILGSNGLSTYDSDGTLKSYVGSDGRIYGTSAVYASSAGSASNANTRYVVIDNNGLRTYEGTGHLSSKLQCSVGSDGRIVAGGGAVTLGEEGLTTYSDGSKQCYVGTDGAFFAGGGKIRIDEVGLSITSSDSISDTPPTFSFKKSSSVAGQPGVYYAGMGVLNSPSKSYFGIVGSGSTRLFMNFLFSYIGGEVYIPGLISGARYFKTGNRYFDAVFGLPQAGDYDWDDGVIGQRYFRICAGYGSSTSAETTAISFPANSSYRFVDAEDVFAWCCSIREGSGAEGNDYVSNITTSGMDCRHEAGHGFFWFAMGSVDSRLS